ncbi:MAG: transposase [Yoonia sp.]|jgi:transposase
MAPEPRVTKNQRISVLMAVTLRGNSADAIVKMFGIASGTIRIHRKNI